MHFSTPTFTVAVDATEALANLVVAAESAISATYIHVDLSAA
jgi:hypothetical protein